MCLSVKCVWFMCMCVCVCVHRSVRINFDYFVFNITIVRHELDFVVAMVTLISNRMYRKPSLLCMFIDMMIPKWNITLRPNIRNNIFMCFVIKFSVTNWQQIK